ncbi:hypothetical protein COLO4_21938 [Corchorus olitorius]|uniref:Uncharacterized protein n=2 Tax=Corchorus olitorius TaxID=93759 RepID=A0A1R3IPW2_9ROSI|nr:hypothetical protein COLO4_21938 [Corchorus olitorius]
MAMIISPCSSISEVEVKASNDHVMSSSSLQNVASNYNEEEDKEKLGIRVGNAILTIMLFAWTLWQGPLLCLARFPEKQPPYEEDYNFIDILFAFSLCGNVGCNIALSYNCIDVIKKFAWGGDRDDEEDIEGTNYYCVIFHSTGFSAIACCCSLVVFGILLHKLNDVAWELAVNCKEVALHTIISWTFKTCPYSIGVPAFIAMAILFGFRTYNLIARKVKVLIPSTGRWKSTAPILSV